MEEEAKVTAQGSRRHSRWTFLAGLLLVLAICFGVYHLVLYLRVANLEAQARAAGFPITAEELEAWYPEPEGENAAPLVLEAGERLAGLPEFSQDPQPNDLVFGVPVFDEVDWPPPGEPISAGMADRIERLLSANREAMVLLERAGAIGQARYPMNFVEGHHALQPHWHILHQGRQLLTVKAVFAAAQGNCEVAAESVRSLLGLARTLNNEPTILSNLIEIRSLVTDADTLEEVTARCELSPEVWKELSEHAEQSSRPEGAVRAWAGERVIGWQTIRISELSGMNKVRGPVGLLRMDQAFWVRYTGDVITMLQSTPPERWRQEVVSVDLEYPRIYLTGLFLPAVQKYVYGHLEGQAVSRLLQLSAALQVYRAERAPGEAAYPPSLTALIPRYLEAVPVDPLDGQPIRYQRLEDGFLVYSVGKDGVDDGGTKYDSNGSPYMPGTDIVFTVRPPSLRAAREQ